MPEASCLSVLTWLVTCFFWEYWSLIKTMWWWKRRKISKEQLFCAGFSLICSAVKGGHYVTSSAHTWPTVWLPNTRGEWWWWRWWWGSVARGVGGADSREERPWKTVEDGLVRKNIAARIGVGSLSLLRLLSQAAVIKVLTSLIMRHENAP